MLAPSGGGSQDDISSGSAAYPTKHFVSSFVTLTPEHECHDKSGLTQGENVGAEVVATGKQREAADVCEICMRVFELKAAAAAKSEEIAGLNVQIVEQLGKVRSWKLRLSMAKLVGRCQSLRLMMLGSQLDSCGCVNEMKNVLFPLLDLLKALKDSPLELLIHEILLSDALAASHARGEKRKKGASSSLEMGGPFVVMPSVSSQDTSLVAADYHISILAIIDGTVSTTEPR
ncbi:hypothetical protein Tco_1406901 [Tanacetum coccineum]